ncbi:MAG: hypothetical protein EOM50_16590 [Erysipelotrichia bacterium]|nr:hypothetical protein [Erysipelotrichia bacterium]
MVKVVTSPEGYQVIGHISVNKLAQPNLVKLTVKIKELFGRLNGSTREMYQTYIDEADKQADDAFNKQLEDLNADAVTQIRTNTEVFEIRGDVYILSKIEALALKENKVE